MKLNEIKEAVLAGKAVHWNNGGYEVIRDRVGQWFILCRLNGSLTSLTWADGVTMSEREEDFFVAPEPVTATFRKPDGEIVKDSSYHEPMTDARAAAEEDAHRYGWAFLRVEVGQ
jgi:hypothetical protein